MVETMSEDQPQIDQLAIFNMTLQALSQILGPARAAVNPGSVYSAAQLEANLGISNTTITLWVDHGLQAYKPGTSKFLFLGDEVIDFIKAHPKLERPKDNLSKIAQRSKGRGK